MTAARTSRSPARRQPHPADESPQLAARPAETAPTTPPAHPAGLWNVMDDQMDWVAELVRVSGSAAA